MPPGSTRRTASSSEMSPSFAMSTAMRTAARAVRFAVAALEHVELAVLDGELEILHVAEVLLERRRDAVELAVRVGHLRLERLVGLVAAARGGSACGVRMPATTSSPCALGSHSPKSFFSPVDGSRVNATPVALVSPRLPKTIACTLHAVPQSSGMSCMRR